MRKLEVLDKPGTLVGNAIVLEMRCIHVGMELLVKSFLACILSFIHVYLVCVAFYTIIPVSLYTFGKRLYTCI